MISLAIYRIYIEQKSENVYTAGTVKILLAGLQNDSPQTVFMEV